MPYAGDVTAQQAHALLGEESSAVIVDCRTKAEWLYVGVPEVPGRVEFLQWSTYPDGDLNARFIDELEGLGIGRDQPVYFLCRSGARSRLAAIEATQAGYEKAYNVCDGFEGPADRLGHRGATAGWKADALPWRQP